jgi:hypothetical protein
MRLQLVPSRPTCSSSRASAAFCVSAGYGATRIELIFFLVAAVVSHHEKGDVPPAAGSDDDSTAAAPTPCTTLSKKDEVGAYDVASCECFVERAV